MISIVCDKPGQFTIREKSNPKAGLNEALLKVNKVGICGTDLHAYAGNQAFFTYPRILGHELATQVLEIGSNEKGLRIGDKVVIIPYIHCGKCIACRNGKTNCCANIKVLGVHTDGGMQSEIAVPVELLIPAPNLSDDEMAIIEPLAIGAHAIGRAGLRSGEVVVVMGCGPIGIGIIKLAQIDGAKVIALDMNEDRLKYVKDKIGADHVVNVSENPVEQVKEITGGDMATAVFDATGSKGALETGHQYMAHGGRYVLVGLSKGELSFMHPAIHAKEMTLMCSRNATYEDFERVMEVVGSGAFPVDSFITHRVPFDQMIDNFDSWLQPETGVIKVVVDF